MRSSLQRPSAAGSRTVELVTGRAKAFLFIGFALAVMADPVSSVAYAIEAALRALDGHLALLLPTMGLVVAIIALVSVNYWYLLRRFPRGGGDPEAVGFAFGPQWVFAPIGALIVDFVLTIAVSISAAASALIAYLPALSDFRIELALLLLTLVGGISWFGHGGRLIFAAMTAAFLAAALSVLALGWLHPSVHGQVTGQGPLAHVALVAVVLAFPVAMALATGIEAPLTAIAQLGQLDDSGKRRFGRGTILATVGIVGFLTLGFAALATHLNIGIPHTGSTQIAEIARAASGGGALFAFFQLASSVLLLAAASSSFQAGPGLLKALSGLPTRRDDGILPQQFAITNRHHTPYVGVALFGGVAAFVILAAAAHEQRLVIFYAVAVFVSFLAGLVAMLRLALKAGSRGLAAINAASVLAVSLTLIVSLMRGWPLVSLLAVAVVGALLYVSWIRAGRPTGVVEASEHAEEE